MARGFGKAFAQARSSDIQASSSSKGGAPCPRYKVGIRMSQVCLTYRCQMNRRIAAVAAITFSVMGSALIAPPASADALSSFYEQTLEWTDCGSLSCAWVNVPLDYANPGGDTIRIRINRSRDGDSTPATHRGAILQNPGGPGVSGLGFTSYVSALLGGEVTRAYDVIGFDQRSVGRSEPVSCMSNSYNVKWLDADSTPDTKNEEQRLLNLAKGIGEGCLDRTPAITAHDSTVDAARDLDIIRASLGDAKLNFLGFSYGTYLGATYAGLFPDRVGRLVLDGALDPTLDAMQLSKGQSDGFQLALKRFMKDCLSRPKCPFTGSTSHALRHLNTFLVNLDTTPLPARPSQPLLQPQAINAVFGSLYATWQWPTLRSAFRKAFNAGDGTALQSISFGATNRTPSGRFTSNVNSAFLAIGCTDTVAPPKRKGLAKAAKQWAKGTKVPEMARAMSWGNAPCSYWPVSASAPAQPITAAGAPPILVVGTKYDPATPLQWAKSLASQLESGTLLQYNGDGHTAYGGSSRCIDNAVNTFFMTGTAPPDGTICQ